MQHMASVKTISSNLSATASTAGNQSKINNNDVVAMNQMARQAQNARAHRQRK